MTSSFFEIGSLPYLSLFRKVQIIVILNAWRDLGRHKNSNEEVTYAEMAHIIFQKRFKVEFLQMYKILGTLILVILYLFLFWFSIPRYSVLQEPAQHLWSHLAGTTQFYRRAVFKIVINQNKPICNCKLQEAQEGRFQDHVSYLSDIWNCKVCVTIFDSLHSYLLDHWRICYELRLKKSNLQLQAVWTLNKVSK